MKMQLPLVNCIFFWYTMFVGAVNNRGTGQGNVVGEKSPHCTCIHVLFYTFITFRHTNCELLHNHSLAYRVNGIQQTSQKSR